MSKSNNSSSASSAITQAVARLQAKVTDDSIASFFQPVASSVQLTTDKLDHKQCASVLQALAKSSIRSSAVHFSPDLRNKHKWTKLVSLVSERALTLKHPRHRSIMESNDHFISLCTSLAKLRYHTAEGAESKLVSRVPHDPAYCFPHLLRYVAETGGAAGAGGVVEGEAAEFAQSLSSTSKHPAWLPAHVACSLSMLYCGEGGKVPAPSLQKINAWIWKCAQRDVNAPLPTRDWLDLFENYLTFKPKGDLVTGDVFLKMRAEYEAHPRQRSQEDVHTSHFQAQVAAALTELGLPFQQEALDGAVDFIVTMPSGKVALQCYGPTHFVFDGSRLEGRTRLRESLLRPLRVVHLDYTRWEYLAAAAERRAYVERALKGAVR